ncbi:protein translocase subunit TIM50 [Sporobolomyces salmoneus]|uniref:protein translocase subunit TIM50 n=1 Tax=Sporobolomyces salmoneus TaxID=183962 RepID=UPI00317DBDE6
MLSTAAARSASLLSSCSPRVIPSLASHSTTTTTAARRYLRSTSKNVPPSSPTPETAPEPTLPNSSSSSSPSVGATQGQPTPSSSDLPPLSSSEPTPTPSGAVDPAAPASQTPPVDALATRSTSIAEAFLDLHPDVEPRSEESKFGDRTGAKAQGASKLPIERKRKNISRGILLGTLVGTGYLAWDLGKEWESEEERKKFVARSDDNEAIEMAQKDGWEGFVGRIRLRGADQLDYLNKPAWDPLIPDPLPEPHYRPYTLVIDLDDMLIHSSWDIEHGWRTAKRPGVDYFLAYLSQFYEIVLFTTQPAYTAAPIAEKLDPYGAYIPWKLFKEATRYKNNQPIKDLSYLNRPLERTIILDTDPSNFQLQPENGIALKPWLGTKGDDPTTKELIAMIPFLEALAVKGVKDVRPVIKYYEGKHIPTAYYEAELRAKKELEEKWEKEKTDNSFKGWISSLFGGLTKTTIRDSAPETDVEKVRKSAQKLYLDEQKYWKDNEEVINKQIEEDKQRQMNEMKSSLLGLIGLAPPSAPQQQQQGPTPETPVVAK